MRRIVEKLLSLNMWLTMLAVVGACGGVLVLVGRLGSMPHVARVGAWLTVPGLVAFTILIAVILPVILWANRKWKR